MDNPSSPYKHLHALFLMKDIDNGYEQLYIMGGHVIPLPSAGIMGLAMLGALGGYRMMRRRSN
jgi:MYXO-CTERM domain-containing protein